MNPIASREQEHSNEDLVLTRNLISKAVERRFEEKNSNISVFNIVTEVKNEFNE